MRSAILTFFLLACGPRVEFTPFSALQAPSPRACQAVLEVYEGDVPILEQAEAMKVGRIEVSNANEDDHEAIAERAAEYGATHMIKVAQQRQLVQSGGMMFGTGGPGFRTGMMVPTMREETYTTYALYRVDLQRVPEALRCR